MQTGKEQQALCRLENKIVRHKYLMMNTHFNQYLIHRSIVCGKVSVGGKQPPSGTFFTPHRKNHLLL
jgi:hypothetical protein